MIKEDNKYYNQAIEYIKTHDLNEMPLGKYVLDEGNLLINIVETDMRYKEDAKLEIHKVFIDIQMPLSKDEQFGIKSIDECKHPIGEYDSANDLLFFNDSIEQIETVEKGCIIVFDTDTAHAPLIGEGRIRKAIIKVRKL